MASNNSKNAPVPQGNTIAWQIKDGPVLTIAPANEAARGVAAALNEQRGKKK